jgi:hypothetical protein
MKLVEVLTAADDPALAAEHVAFHLAAGVDLVLTAAPLEHEGVVVTAGADATTLARAAATDHGADWVLLAEADEFWWPRGESLKDPLAAMPARYGVVQALARTFAPPSDGGDGTWAERMTRRPSLHGEGPVEPLEAALRPLYRADPSLDLDPAARRRRVPLRAWYPFEVLRFPVREPAAMPPSGDLVVDTRLRDALAELRATGGVTFRVPDLVDDAAYAAECAAVGEVDLGRLEREVAELEHRIAWLEGRLWPRLLRRLGRLARR